MLTTKRKPATVGEILVEEFMQPMALTQAALAEAMGVQRKHVNELCNDRRTVTAATALILARVFGIELLQFTRRYRAHGRIKTAGRENLFEHARIFVTTGQVQRRAPLRDCFVLHVFFRTNVAEQLMRSPDLIPYRKRLLSLAEGRVLEIGLGSGLNLPFYPAQTTEILGLDPHPKLLAMARRKILSIPTSNIEGSAELIPLDSRSIDTVVTTWTLCSIPHVRRALAEVRRVLKPGGQFLFVEHGLAPDDKVRRWQRRLTPVWKKISGGCHLDRPMEMLVHDAGFHVASLRTGYMPGPKPMTFMYEGCAHPL